MPVTPTRVRKPIPRRLRSSWPSGKLDPDDSPRAVNVRFKFGEVRNAPGREILAGPATNQTVQWIGQYPTATGTIWPLMLTQSHLYRWGAGAPGTPRQWSEVTGAFSPSGTRKWTTAVGEGDFFFCRGDDTIAYWDGNTGNQFKVITPTDAGTPPKSRFVEYFNNRLCGFYNVEGGNTYATRMRWAQSGDFTKWDDTSGLGAGFLDLVAGGAEAIRGVKVLGERCVVYTRRAIKEIVATGQSSPIHVEQLRAKNVGCDAPYTIADNGLQHFFLGYDHNVWTWDGIQARPIGYPILEELSALLTPTNMDTYFGVVQTHRQEYWLVLNTGDVFVYDYARDAWTRDTFANLTALGEVDDPMNAQTWSTLTGPWSTLFPTWSELGGTSDTHFFGGRSDGATMLIDDMVAYDYFAIGSIMDRFVETNDDYFANTDGAANPDNNGALVRMLLVYEYVNAEAFEVGVSTDRGRTWTTQQVTPTQAGFTWLDWNLTGNQVRYRFRENNASGAFRWREYGYNYTYAGEYGT